MKKLLVLLLLTSFAAAQQINYARMLSGVNYQSTVTSYTFVPLDATRPVVLNSGIAVAVTLPSGLTSGFGAGKMFDAINAGSGVVTITCSGCTITALGQTVGTLTLNQAQGADIYSDGANYVANVYGVATIPFTIAIPGTAAKCMAYYPNGTVATINGDCSILTDANGNLSAKSITTTDTSHAGFINFIGGATPGSPLANQGQLYYDSVGNNFKAVKNLTLYTLCTSAGETGCTNAVTSVFTRTGAVTAQTGDYTAAQVTNAVAKVASGTAALGTGAISSGTCATVVTVSATGTLTTDVIQVGFNGDPTGVTGYVPATTGMLTIIPYPTADNVNFKVCNNTGGSITPGAITVNWKVTR